MVATNGSGVGFTSWIAMLGFHGIDVGDRCHSRWMFARLIVVCGMTSKNALFAHASQSEFLAHGADLWTTKDAIHYSVQWLGLFINGQWCKKYLGINKMRRSTGKSFFWIFDRIFFFFFLKYMKKTKPKLYNPSVHVSSHNSDNSVQQHLEHAFLTPKNISLASQAWDIAFCLFFVFFAKFFFFFLNTWKKTKPKLYNPSVHVSSHTSDNSS